MKRIVVFALVAVLAGLGALPAHALGDASGPDCSDIIDGFFSYATPAISVPPSTSPTVSGTMLLRSSPCSDVKYALHVFDAAGNQVANETLTGADGSTTADGKGQVDFNIPVPLVDPAVTPPYINTNPSQMFLVGETILPDGTQSDRAPDTGLYGPMALNDGPPGYAFH